MKKIVSIGFIIILGAISYYLYNQNTKKEIAQEKSPQTTNQSSNDSDIPEATTIAEGLDTPWSLVFLPDKSILFTERPGRIRRIVNDSLETDPVITLPNVRQIGEGGLLGMALHPEFEKNNYIYIYYTYSSAGNNTLNRVVRMTYGNGKLTNEEILVDSIPGASNHNGGRIKFGPDGYLYVTTGDAEVPSQAQDKNSLAGKILRVTETGKAAPGNPFNNRTYSYGHRNPQGLAWDNKGHLWATEHGRSGVQSGLDELNLIESGKNYGWPEIQGDETQSGMETAKANSGSTTWAPAEVVYLNNSLYFGALRGKSLYQAVIQGTNVSTVNKFLNDTYGRIREVAIGPDNMLYISTSNQDGRGTPESGDDRIIRINPSKISNY